MVNNLGVVKPGSTLYIYFDSFAGSTGASITLTGLLTSDIEIYKNGSVTQRASDNGYTLLDTDGIDFDGITGIHGISISLADNSDAGFYVAGADYVVVISSVTIDTQTVNFVAARFTIGYEDAIINTTIATLASQTSFTLTAGPAEDDALNGCEVVIHDIASAVQLKRAIIQDYTGASKTVTLVADQTSFTAAAGDNISIFLSALQPTTQGRTVDVSTSGEAGIDWANIGSPTTAQNLSGTNIDVDQVVASVSGAVGSVTGNVGGNVTGSVGSVVGNVGGNVVGSVASVTGNVGGNVVGSVGSVTGNVGGNVVGSVGSVVATVAANLTQILGTALTETAGQIAAGFKKLFDVAVPVMTMENVNQTGDSFARIGVNGAGLSNIDLPDQTMNITGNITGNLSGSVGSVTGAVGSVTGAVGSVTGNVGGNVNGSVGSVVGAVGSVTGNVGGNVNGTVASVVGNVGGNVVGSVGSVVGLTPANLDTTVSSRATPAQVNAEVVDVMNVDTYGETSGVPGATDTIINKLSRLYDGLINKLDVTASKKKFYNNSDVAQWEKDLSDDGVTYSETKGNAP